jgi:hypothetical protein
MTARPAGEGAITAMEYVWTFPNSAVTVCGVDFLDPALAVGPGVRARGVRLEVRPVRRQRSGSIYASESVQLEPAVLRVDLLESAPHAADRMHWHPGMRAGEPGDRVFDRSMGEDPGGWLEGFLAAIADAAVESLEAEVAESLRSDGPAIAASAGSIVERVMQLLTDAREPWPSVTHDERGLATF